MAEEEIKVEEKTFTQDDVNAIIDKRLKKFGDYDDLKEKVGGYEQKIADMAAAHEKEVADMTAAHEAQVTDLNAKIASYENDSVKMRIALETGLPADLADRLQGTDEESLRADAEKLIGYAKPQTAPKFEPEPVVETDPHKAALKQMLSQMKN